jgi:hypothetical protein
MFRDVWDFMRGWGNWQKRCGSSWMCEMYIYMQVWVGTGWYDVRVRSRYFYKIHSCTLPWSSGIHTTMFLINVEAHRINKTLIQQEVSNSTF